MGVYKNTKEQNRSSNDSHGLPRPRDRCKMWPVCMYVSTSGYSETKNKKESLKTHKITEMMPFRNPPLSAPPARCKGGMEGPPALQSPQLPKKNASRDERAVVEVGQRLRPRDGNAMCAIRGPARPVVISARPPASAVVIAGRAVVSAQVLRSEARKRCREFVRRPAHASIPACRSGCNCGTVPEVRLSTRTCQHVDSISGPAGFKETGEKTYTSPLLHLGHRISRLGPVAVHWYVLLTGLPASIFTRPLAMYPVLLDHVPNIFELLQRHDEAGQQRADLALRRHPRYHWLRALLLACGSRVSLGKVVAIAACIRDLHCYN